MREIKFRAWVTSKVTNKSWMNHEIEFIGGKINDVFASRGGQLSDITYLQYTGLKDKEGREIYEGDILTDHGDEGPLYIEYSKGHAAFVFVDKFDSFGTTLYTTDDISYEGFGVIGNIHDNPELLEWRND